MASIVIIADDLTGAADTGVQFAPYFDRTVLVSYLQLSGGLQKASRSHSRATAVYSNSRSLAAEAAGDRLLSAAGRIARSQVTWLYKKIDSCLRGNLGPEIEAFIDELDYEASFIAPAFPEMGRTTKEDIHRIYGVPLARTEVARDPAAPATESRLSRLVEIQSRYPVGHVPLTMLEDADTAGLQSQIERLIRSGIRHIAFDATSRAHLDTIARLYHLSPHRILPVGSAGLAGSISRMLPLDPVVNSYAPVPPPKGMHLLVCGSASQVTRKQIRALTAAHPYTEIVLDPQWLARSNPKEKILRTSPEVCSTLSTHHVIIKIDPSPDGGSILEGSSKRLQAAEMIVKNLGRLVASVLAVTRPAFLFVSGGDTADAVFTALAATGMEIHGEILPGVVRGTLLGGPMDGLPVVTKAGAFGRQNTLVELHRAWQAISGGG